MYTKLKNTAMEKMAGRKFEDKNTFVGGTED
jgi:hypothetical protein